MMTKVESYISERRLQLERLTGKLRSIDPTPWMAEGWTQLSKNGKRIKDSEQMTVGDVIEARLIKAKIELKVASIT
jgi:exonuclease VII large subunit